MKICLYQKPFFICYNKYRIHLGGVMLIKIFKKSYDILRQNLIIIQPFILYLLLLSLVLGSIHSVSGSLQTVLIIFLISIFALTCAFIAGWLQLFQAAIRTFDKDTFSLRSEMSFGILREFFPAVGRFFIPITMAVILYFIMLFGVFKLIMFLGVKYIGFTQNITPENIKAVFENKAQMEAFVLSLTSEDRLKLLKWDLLSIFLIGFYSYITMFWFPAILMNGENAFKAFFTGVKAVFSKPFTTLGIFSIYWVVNFCVNIISAIIPNLLIAHILNLMFLIFITSYFIMVNFVYFEENSGNNISGWTNIFR